MTVLLSLAIAFLQFGGGSPPASAASLGLVIGTNVQAYDADLTTYAGITPSLNVQTMLGSADYAEIRTNLNLGSSSFVDFLVITANAGLVNYGKMAYATNPITSASSPYTVTQADHWILCNPAGGDTTINLLEPGVTAYAGHTICAKKTTSNANKCVMDTPGAHTIDGAASIDLDTDYEFRCVMSTGSQWVTIDTGVGP